MNIQYRSIAIITLLATAHVPHALGSSSQQVEGLSSLETPRANDFEQRESVLTSEHAEFTFEGIVRSVTGNPVFGAVVVSSAGGQATTDENGMYRLATQLPLGAKEVYITAISGSGQNKFASSQLQVPTVSGSVPVAPLQLMLANSCVPSWLPTFGGEPGTGDVVRALAVFDDGSGPAIFAAGDFRSAGGIPANYIAKWDGISWTALGSGLDARVRTLLVFDDGNGPKLVAGGLFTTAGGVSVNEIAAWDGSSWSTLASGVSGGGIQPSVHSLAIFDDGNGDALYVGGQFTDASGSAANSIARWNGSNWSTLGIGIQNGAINATVNALTVFDDGNGDKLYAGGYFATAGGVMSGGLASWDGLNWAAVGGNVSSSGIFTLTVFDDGTGDALFIGGAFPSFAGVSATNVIKWNGSNYSRLGMGLTGGRVTTLATYDDGNGERLIAGGMFTNAGGLPATGIAQWDGSSWATPTGDLTGASSPGSLALLVTDDGTGQKLYAGGRFRITNGVPANFIAKWDGSNWAALGSGVNFEVAALEAFDDGSGQALFAGGSFRGAGGVAVNAIAKWNGSNWSALGSGMDFSVRAMTVFDDGNGPALFVGGFFSTAGGVVVNQIARWDGSTWTSLGTGMTGIQFESTSVNALEVFDDGSGIALFAAGDFATAGGVAAANIAKWDGSTWSALGAGFTSLAPNIFGDPVSVRSLTIFDDGSGAALYAGGFFLDAGGTPASNIAKWNGSIWTPLGSGADAGVTSLAVFNDGGGNALFAAGLFGSAGGVLATRIAKWDGSSWAPLGGGANGPTTATIQALTVFDDGTGEALYAGGTFELVDGTAAARIAKWDGANWSPLGSGLVAPLGLGVNALAVFDDGNGDALYAGGHFTSAPDSGDSYLAKWGCDTMASINICNGDGGNQAGCTNCPCGNNAMVGTIGGCLNSSGRGAQLTFSGSASISLPTMIAGDLRFAVSSAPANAFCILNSGDAVAPLNMANPCFGLQSGAQSVPFDGLRCAVLNTRRHGGRASDSNGDVGLTNDPWGGEGGPPVGIARAGGGFAAGQTRYFQAIYRDDSTLVCMRGLNTSQAAKVVFKP